MARYDFKCGHCSHVHEASASMKSDPRALRKCPMCGHRKARRQLAMPVVGDAIIKYSNRFPYVSNAMPFKGAGATHVGPLGKCLITSKSHEDTMRKIHGYVGQGG